MDNSSFVIHLISLQLILKELMKHFIFSFALLLFVFSCKNAPKDYTTTEPTTTKVTKDFFHTTTEILVSAHRGGSDIKNYPENALETMKFLKSKGVRVFEIDVFQSSDKKVMLLHDDHLERTTTGNGSLRGKSSDELRKLQLVDDFGNKTNYQIPFLKDVLKWGKESGAFFMVDFKKSAKYKDVIKLIRQENMQDQCVLISYSTGAAEKLNRLAPEMMISVSARNEQELDWLLKTEIPTDKMIAFTGTKFSPQSLYDRLNKLKIPAILGTLGNLDKRARAKGNHLYRKWADMGIQIIATDRALDAQEALK